MRLVDLTLPWSPAHVEPFPGHPKPQVKAFQNHTFHRLETHILELTMHAGTHLDAPYHGAPNGKDVAELGFDVLFGTTLILDMTPYVKPLAVFTPEQVEEAAAKIGEEVRPGDRLLFYTGWQKYAKFGPERDDEMFWLQYPAASIELIDWLAERRVALVGQDAPSLDHPINVYLRKLRPNLVRAWEEETGLKADDVFPEDKFAYGHRRLGEVNIPHLDLVSGEIGKLASSRVTVGVFPWRFVGGEASICRVVAFLDE